MVKEVYRIEPEVLTLPENTNIYAKEYKLYLPDKKLLQKKLKEWLDEEQKNNL